MSPQSRKGFDADCSDLRQQEWTGGSDTNVLVLELSGHSWNRQRRELADHMPLVSPERRAGSLGPERRWAIEVCPGQESSLQGKTNSQVVKVPKLWGKGMGQKHTINFIDVGSSLLCSILFIEWASLVAQW